MKISNTTCNGMSVDCKGMSMDEITSLENKYMHMYHCVVRACPNTGTILIHTALPLDDVDLAEIDTRKAGSHVVV
jgi:hypothetical protein